VQELLDFNTDDWEDSTPSRVALHIDMPRVDLDWTSLDAITQTFR
jgi:hypothetical protein